MTIGLNGLQHQNMGLSEQQVAQQPNQALQQDEAIDWSRYFADEDSPEILTQPTPQNPPTPEERKLGFEIDVPEKPVNWNQYMDPTFLEREFQKETRRASRIGEALAGAPGDIVSMVEWANSKLPNLGMLDREPNFIQKAGQKFLKSFPNSYELKQVAADITNGFTDPQNAYEEFEDEIIQLSTMLATGNDLNSMASLMTQVGKAIGAKGIGKYVEKLGGGPLMKGTAEIGSLLLMGLFAPQTARQYLADRHTQAVNMVPQGTMINTNDLAQELINIEQNLTRGVATPTKNAVLTPVRELSAKAQGGAMEVSEIIEAYHDLNEIRTSRSLFENLDRADRRMLGMRLDRAQEPIREKIQQYGQGNQDFLRNWQQSNEGYRAFYDSQRATRFLERFVGRLPIRVAEGMAVELVLGHPKAAAVTGGAFAALKTGEMLHRVANSPVMRQHYVGVLRHAAESNAGGLVKELSALDNELKKSFNKDLKAK